MPGRAYEKEQVHQFLFGQKTKTGLFMLWGTRGTGKTAVVRLSTQAYLRTKPSARVIKVYGNDIKAERKLLTNLAISLTGKATKKTSMEASEALLHGHFKTSNPKAAAPMMIHQPPLFTNLHDPPPPSVSELIIKPATAT